MRTAAVSHDLFKPVDWAHHNNPRWVAERFNRHKLLELLKKFLYPDWHYKTGENEPKALEHAVKEHHGQKLFATADKLASAAGRLRYEWNYWRPGASRVFIVKVYGREGNIKYLETGEKPLEKILNILDRCADSQDAFCELNDFLSEYPADSQFPLVGLKAHHWLTDAFRRSKRLRELCYRENRDPERVGLIRCSIPEQNFHRLRDLRAFRYYVNAALQFIESKFNKFKFIESEVFVDRLPARIGDEIYVAYVEDEVEQLVSRLIDWVRESSLLVRVTLYEWFVEKVPVGGGSLFRIKSSSEKIFFAGNPELPALAPEKADEWAKELEEFEKVLWVYVGLSKKVEDAAKEFLDRADKEVLSKMEREPAERLLVQEVNLSPDLLISLAEGLEEFYMDCARVLAGGYDPESVIVLRGLEGVLMVKGVEEASRAIEIYHSLDELRKKLLVSVNLTAVLCDNKYPFWSVREILNVDKDKREILNTQKDHIVIVRGERLLRITSRDVPDIRRVAEVIERNNVKRSQMEDLVKEAGKVDGPEPLKLLIDVKAKEGKLGGRNSEFVARQLANLIDVLYSRHRDMRVVQEALDLLSSYAKRE